jgi:hypothetical protein
VRRRGERQRQQKGEFGPADAPSPYPVK